MIYFNVQALRTTKRDDKDGLQDNRREPGPVLTEMLSATLTACWTDYVNDGGDPDNAEAFWDFVMRGV